MSLPSCVTASAVLGFSWAIVASLEACIRMTMSRLPRVLLKTHV
jgi:hypothetical protein